MKFHWRWIKTSLLTGKLKFLAQKTVMVEFLARSTCCRSFKEVSKKFQRSFKEVSKVRQIFKSSSYWPYHNNSYMARGMPAKRGVQFCSSNTILWSCHPQSGLIHGKDAWHYISIFLRVFEKYKFRMFNRRPGQYTRKYNYEKQFSRARVELHYLKPKLMPVARHFGQSSKNRAFGLSKNRTMLLTFRIFEQWSLLR